MNWRRQVVGCCALLCEWAPVSVAVAVCVCVCESWYGVLWVCHPFPANVISRAPPFRSGRHMALTVALSPMLSGCFFLLILFVFWLVFFCCDSRTPGPQPPDPDPAPAPAPARHAAREGSPPAKCSIVIGVVEFFFCIFIFFSLKYKKKRKVRTAAFLAY